MSGLRRLCQVRRLLHYLFCLTVWLDRCSFHRARIWLNHVHHPSPHNHHGPGGIFCSEGAKITDDICYCEWTVFLPSSKSTSVIHSLTQIDLSSGHDCIPTISDHRTVWTQSSCSNTHEEHDVAFRICIPDPDCSLSCVWYSVLPQLWSWAEAHLGR